MTQQLRFNTTIEQMARDGYKPVLQPTMIKLTGAHPHEEREVRKYLRGNRDKILSVFNSTYLRNAGSDFVGSIDAFVIHTQVRGSRENTIHHEEKFSTFYTVLPYKKEYYALPAIESMAESAVVQSPVM